MSYCVDLPNPNDLGENASWTNVSAFDTKEEAVAWIRANIGYCDDEGNLSLITNCPQHTD